MVNVHGLLAESTSSWIYEVSRLNELWNLWTAIKDGNVKVLEQVLDPRGPIAADAFVNGRLPFIDDQWHIRGLRGSATRNLLALATESLAQGVNSQAAPSISATILCVDSNGSLKLHSRPDNLRAALWLQFAESVAGVRSVRPCEICGELMSPTQPSGKGS